MAITVIVEDGSQVVGANSYRSIANITEWVLTNPHDSTWTTLTETQQKGYAIMSCRILNEQMDWDGWVIDADQALDLPRSGMVNRKGRSIDNDEIPSEVQDAQSELARLLAIGDRTGDADTAGFSEIEVGSIKLVMDKTDRAPILPDSVLNMVKALGTKAISKGTSRTIRA